MYQTTFANVTINAGEDAQITFNVTDNNGAPVTVAGGQATFKIARKLGQPAIATKTQAFGITLTGSQAIVLFNAADVSSGAVQLHGDFIGQLYISLGGIGLYSSRGIITIDPVIA